MIEGRIAEILSEVFISEAIQSYYENLLPTVEEIIKLIDTLPTHGEGDVKNLAKSIRSEMLSKIKGDV